VSHKLREPFAELSPDSFFSLPTFDEKTTELHLHAEKLTETVLHLTWDTLWVCFVLFCFVYFIFPFDETTTEQHLRHHLRIGG
jgi:hypothetical protein